MKTQLYEPADLLLARRDCGQAWVDLLFELYVWIAYAQRPQMVVGRNAHTTQTVLLITSDTQARISTTLRNVADRHGEQFWAHFCLEKRSRN